ncbi:hypothetical protein CASFOL_003806 [Castilleja foliolosa]|uniref:Single-stranded DNA binding protein Ssb-like OB fold domain-containing protein n=1 Tax=Castilleja foliolosa TaxID=1961234 RepID=A0ABD3EIL7_9LAMI
MADHQKNNQFIKVNKLRPLGTGLNLTVKVVNAKTVVQRGQRIAECLVGDETAMIVFVATNDQVNLAVNGNTLALSNARVDMFRGSMRLRVDGSGRVDVVKSVNFTVKENNNLSLIEFDCGGN